MQDFILNVEDPVHKIAVGENLTLSVVGDGAEVFHRRAIKIAPNGAQETVSMLVGRVAGVSIYIQDDKLILSPDDLYL